MNFDELLPLIKEAGAAKAGVAPLAEVEAEEFARFKLWLAQRRNGSMAYLANNLEIRRNPALLLSADVSAGSILSFAFPYYSADPYLPGKLRFARYALGDDYHEVLRRRLRPVADAIADTTGCQARICVDTAPILERYWAVKAGLGFIGRNRQLIIPGLGSHFFLAEIVTDAVVRAGRTAPPDLPAGCLECGRCLRACPGQALSAEGFDARRCLSYLTIEHRPVEGETVPSVPPSRRKYFYGCDICLDVCPLAKGGHPVAPLAEFTPRPDLLTLDTHQITALTQSSFSLLFRHSAVKRIKLSGLQRINQINQIT